MSILIKLKNKFLLFPFGLYNNSVLCYFNSLIQTLLSCTSITEYLLENKENFKNNSFLKIYIKLIEKYKDIKTDNYTIENMNLLLFSNFLKKLKQKKINFGFDQEDSGELLLLLLEVINDKYIYNLFMHKYRCNIYCRDCKNMINISNDVNTFFEMNIDEINNNFLKSEIDCNLDNLNKYVRNNYSELENYKCNNCHVYDDCIKINRLILTPTIIIINLNKYSKKGEYTYPLQLIFKNKKQQNIYYYNLISTINHSGNQNFGHYVTKTIRKKIEDSKSEDFKSDIYLLNDTSYEVSNFDSNLNVYLLFYHFVKQESY